MILFYLEFGSQKKRQLRAFWWISRTQNGIVSNDINFVMCHPTVRVSPSAIFQACLRLKWLDNFVQILHAAAPHVLTYLLWTQIVVFILFPIYSNRFAHINTHSHAHGNHLKTLHGLFGTIVVCKYIYIYILHIWNGQKNGLTFIQYSSHKLHTAHKSFT